MGSQNENQTLASITFQACFRLYEKRGDDRGTAVAFFDSALSISWIPWLYRPTVR
ncbi:hypothetical protein MJ561_05340 [Klebsiella pneumoniae]|nr:hypothetical protein MJ561_05340 [Klebsiella pneumoniae]